MRVILPNCFAKCWLIQFNLTFLWNNNRVGGCSLECTNSFLPHFVDTFHWTVKNIAIIIFNSSYKNATSVFLLFIALKSQINAIIMYVPTTSL